MWFERWPRFGKRVAARALERLWEVGFRAAATLAPVAVERLLPKGTERILIVAPHPDDEAIGCAGAVILHVAAGDRVTIAIATDGRRSRTLPYTDAMADADAMACRRRAEAAAAAALMRVHRLEWLGLREGEWQIPVLQQALQSLIEEVAPDVIYAPSLIDFHPEHLKVAHALALALDAADAAAKARIRLRVYQVQVPLTALLVNLVADVSSTQRDYESALRAYRSQAGSVHCTYRERHYVAIRHRLPAPAEAFWALTALRYIELHRAPPSARSTAFRGLRHFPLTDPFAYLAGRRERRRIRGSCAAEQIGVRRGQLAPDGGE